MREGPEESEPGLETKSSIQDEDDSPASMPGSLFAVISDESVGTSDESIETGLENQSSEESSEEGSVGSDSDRSRDRHSTHSDSLEELADRDAVTESLDSYLVQIAEGSKAVQEWLSLRAEYDRGTTTLDKIMAVFWDEGFRSHCLSLFKLAKSHPHKSHPQASEASLHFNFTGSAVFGGNPGLGKSIGLSCKSCFCLISLSRPRTDRELIGVSKAPELYATLLMDLGFGSSLKIEPLGLEAQVGRLLEGRDEKTVSRAIAPVNILSQDASCL